MCRALLLEDCCMKEILTTVTGKGQLTLPAEVRRHLKLEIGQKIALVLELEGTVRLRLPRYATIASRLAAPARKLRRPLGWKATREIARADAIPHHRRYEGGRRLECAF